MRFTLIRSNDLSTSGFFLSFFFVCVYGRHHHHQPSFVVHHIQEIKLMSAGCRTADKKRISPTPYTSDCISVIRVLSTGLSSKKWLIKYIHWHKPYIIHLSWCLQSQLTLPKKKMKMFTYKNLIRRNLKVPSFFPMGHKLIIKHCTAAQEVYI